MNQKFRLFFAAVFYISIISITGIPYKTALAQCGGPAGGACPTDPAQDEDDGGKRTPTPIPPTQAPTETPTNTSTPTHKPTFTPTATDIPNTVTPTYTLTATSTPSPTPVPVAHSVLPGVGIGTILLFLIVGILLPALQKVRVARRGY